MRLYRPLLSLSSVLLATLIFFSSCGKELSTEIPNGIDLEDSTGIWLIKTMSVQSFGGTTISGYSSRFEYDTVLRSITFVDTFFYDFRNTSQQFDPARAVYQYDDEGKLLSVVSQTPTGTPQYKVGITYDLQGLASKFRYEDIIGGTGTNEIDFNWQPAGSGFYGSYIDPSVGSVPFSFGDRRFLVNSALENEETIYISQDTANYADSKELPVRNNAGDVIEEKYQSRINGTSRYVTTDSLVYQRDNQSKSIYNFYRIWAGSLHWYNDGYSIGFTQGLTRYTDIFDFDKYPMIKKTHYRRDNLADPFTKYDEETMQIVYDANKNPIKLTLFGSMGREREVNITWEKIEW